MDRHIQALTLAVAALALLCAGCKSATSSSNNAAPPAVGNSNRQAGQATSNANQAAASAAPADAAKNQGDVKERIIGAYTLGEVHKGGVVTMMSQVKTSISFLPDGTYARVSQRGGGAVYHTDTGRYELSEPNKLTLLIESTRGQIFNPPHKVQHTFTLSPDGEELKLTSEGSTAVFRRIKD